MSTEENVQIVKDFFASIWPRRQTRAAGIARIFVDALTEGITTDMSAYQQ